MAENSPKKFISIREAAERLGIHRVSAYRLAESGKLPSTKLGGRRLVPESALEQLEAAALHTGKASA